MAYVFGRTTLVRAVRVAPLDVRRTRKMPHFIVLKYTFIVLVLEK